MCDNCWQILGIDPTDDEAIIKRAYAKLLKGNKPDKNPDGFKRLREAYDEALQQRHWYIEAYDDEENNQETTSDTDDDTCIHVEIVGENNAVVLEAISDRFVLLPYEHGNSPLPVIAQDKTTEISSPIAVYGKLPDKRFEKDTDEESCENEATVLEKAEISPAVAVYGKLPDIPFNLEDDNEQLDSWVADWQERDDSQLCQILTQQFDQLKQQSLDFNSDYEVELLYFLAHSDNYLFRSYRLSFNYFNWQKRLDSWQVDEYPWSMLQAIADRNPFLDSLINHTKAQFTQQYYPEVFNVLCSEKFNRLEFLRQVGSVPALAHQLAKLNYELDRLLQVQLLNQSDEAILQAIDKYQKDDELMALNEWVFKRLVMTKDLIYLALIAAVLGVLGTLLHHNDISYGVKNGVLIFVGMSVWLGFWQLLFKVLVNPSRFTFDGQDIAISRGMVIASVLLFGLFYYQWSGEFADWQNSMAKPSYFLCHIAGMTIWALVFYHEQDKRPVDSLGTLNSGFILILLAIGMPLLGLVSGLKGRNASMEIMAISPLFWIIFTLPILVHRYAHWRPLEVMAYWIKATSSFVLGFYLIALFLVISSLNYGMAGFLLFLVGILQYGLIKGRAFVSPALK